MLIYYTIKIAQKKEDALCILLICKWTFSIVHIRKLFYSLFIFFKMVQHIIYKLNRFRSTAVAIFA